MVNQVKCEKCYTELKVIALCKNDNCTGEMYDVVIGKKVNKNDRIFVCKSKM